VNPALDSHSSKKLKDTLARSRSRYPDERLLGLRRSVEGESEPARGEDERKRSTQRIARVLPHVEPHNELAFHRPIELDAQK